MLNAIKKKDKFIEEVERKFASLMDAYRNLNESVKSHYGITEIDDVNTKFQTLKKALNALGWKITNFKNNQLDLDSTVQNSFVELTPNKVGVRRSRLKIEKREMFRN
ncbi:MAG: hypothetical protein ACE5HI_10640 [bacterium]